MTKITTVSLTDAQKAWIDENSINLSRFLQKKINERMNKDLRT